MNKINFIEVNKLNTKIEEVENDLFSQYKTQVLIWEIVGLVAIIGIGTLWHYLFEWLGSWKPIGWLFPINEATWEHTKMSFWTGLFIYIAQYFFLGKHFKKFIVGKTIGLYLGILGMLSFWYTVQGALGASGMWFGILTYCFAVIVQQGSSVLVYTLKWDMEEKNQKILNIISLVGVGLLIVAMILFTYIQPQLPTFFDFENGVYGFVP